MKYSELTETLEEIESYIVAGDFGGEDENHFDYTLTEILDDQLIYLYRAVLQMSDRIEHKEELYVYDYIARKIDTALKERKIRYPRQF